MLVRGEMYSKEKVHVHHVLTSSQYHEYKTYVPLPRLHAVH